MSFSDDFARKEKVRETDWLRELDSVLSRVGPGLLFTIFCEAPVAIYDFRLFM